MKELLKKIMENAENPEAVDFSEGGIRTAAKALGYSDADIKALFENFEGFPLDEDDLAEISGGGGISVPSRGKNPSARLG